MKKCLKRLLLCSIVLLLLNCQSEDLALDSHEHSKLRIQRISLEELKSKPKALEALKKIREKSKTDAQGKLTYNSANDFYVDTEEIVYIEKEETHSYTFAVYRKESTAYFENLVMTLQEDGSYSSTLVSYNLTEQEKYDLDHEQLYSLDGKMSASVLNAGSVGNELLMNRTSCTTIQIPTCSYHHTHFAGANCTKIDGSIDITICTDISEPHAPISYISPGGSGGSSGGGGGSPITQTPIASNPTPEPTVLPDSQSPINNIGNITVPLIKPSPIERFLTGLEDDEEDWLNAHATIKAIITNYVSQNTQDFPFAEDLIENCMDNNLNNEDSKEYVVSNIIEKQIDDSQLDDCTKDILNDLKNLENNDISKMMRRFDFPESVFKVNIEKGELPAAYPLIRFGSTDYNINSNGNPIRFEYEITLNQNYFTSTKGTKLFKATVIMHEMIHALMRSLIDENNAGTLTPQSDFNDIWNLYQQISQDDHELIASRYVTIIADALKELDNNAHSQELYTDLAWIGLEGTDIYNTTTSLTQADKDRLGGDRLWAEAKCLPTNTVQPSTPPCD